jgi:hypothetical protein
MKWLLENPWVFIVIAGLVAQVLKALQKGQGGAAEAAPKKEYEFDDPELAERTRKIREEIRRKIEQRRGGANQPEPVPPVVIESSSEATPPPVVIRLPEVVREVLTPSRTPEPAEDRGAQIRAAAELERQVSLEERLQEAMLLKQSADRRVAFEATTADPEPAALVKTRGTVLDDLRDPAALRRAFILREVLGPPVALR